MSMGLPLCYQSVARSVGVVDMSRSRTLEFAGSRTAGTCLDVVYVHHAATTFMPGGLGWLGDTASRFPLEVIACT